MRFSINGAETEVEVRGDENLLWVLREELHLKGTKDACLEGECGSCTVLMDGEPVCSCLVLAADAEGAEIVTVEGIGTPEDPHPIQQSLVDHGAAQCGFCTPGIVVSAYHLLETTPAPTEAEIREALAGNICRCTGYGSIIRAIGEL